MNRLRVVLGLIVLPVLPGLAFGQTSFKLQNGDLLFQDLDCGGLCDAIESVTQGYKDSRFSHVGIVRISEKGQPEVLEAIGKNVHYTPLQTFLDRQLDANKKPKVAVGRFTKEYQGLIPGALKQGELLVGKPYDDVFAMNNDAYYCSELIYEMFKAANRQQPVFELQPMTYATPGTEQIMPVWETYFKELNKKVPQGEPGLNPGGISCSNKLEIFFPYGAPAKNISRKN